MNSDSNCVGDCDGSAGSGLNGTNVFLLIVLIPAAFLIPAPKKPMFHLFQSNNDQPSVPPPTASNEAPPHPDQCEDEEKPIVVSFAPSERTEDVTPEGRRIVRETVTHPDGRQVVTETVEEPTIIEQPRDQTFVTTQEMTTDQGNRMTVEMTKHADGRQEVVETVEEPSVIDSKYTAEPDVPLANAIVEEVVETFEETSMIEVGTVASRTARDPSIIGDNTAQNKDVIVETKQATESDGRRSMDPPDN